MVAWPTLRSADHHLGWVRNFSFHCWFEMQHCQIMYCHHESTEGVVLGSGKHSQSPVNVVHVFASGHVQIQRCFAISQFCNFLQPQRVFVGDITWYQYAFEGILFVILFLSQFTPVFFKLFCVACAKRMHWFLCRWYHLTHHQEQGLGSTVSYNAGGMRGRYVYIRKGASLLTLCEVQVCDGVGFLLAKISNDSKHAWWRIYCRCTFQCNLQKPPTEPSSKLCISCLFLGTASTKVPEKTFEFPLVYLQKW